MQNWDEIHVAFQVARLGTVSGAARKLNVHHATVIRHIDALEHRLGVRLFQRHARGYTPTEAGQELLQVAAVADEHFAQMEGRIRGQIDTISGELVVAALPGGFDVLARAISRFQVAYPSVIVRNVMDESVARLEYGEAHVAIRAGEAPQNPDNIVQALTQYQFGLYASQDYVTRHGVPSSEQDFAGHRFVGHEREDHPSPFMRWMAKTVPRDQVMTRTNEFLLMEEAVRSGAGIGFLRPPGDLEQSGLVEILAPQPAWQVDLWAVTHVDLHRTHKVQAFLEVLKSEFHK